MTENYSHDFVERCINNTFVDFESYYEFLEGDIYDNACYYQYNFSDETVSKYKLIRDKLNMQSLINETIDDFFPEPSDEELEQYAENEKKKKACKKWISRFNECSTYDEFMDVYIKHQRSRDYTFELFYLWNYIKCHKEESFKVMMEFVSNSSYAHLKYALCFVFGAERTLKAYKYKGGSESTNIKYTNQFKETVSDIINIGVIQKNTKYFDKSTHYYVIKTEIYLKNNLNKAIVDLYKYFETFEEFAKYLENDISDCDLSNALSLKADFDKYKSNEKTRLPINAYTNLSKVVLKSFDRKWSQFRVIIKWCNSNNMEVSIKNFHFRFFFDFAAFLKNDLSYADLLFCDGLSNISNFSGINFENTRVRSSILKGAGIACQQDSVMNNSMQQFYIPKINEKETLLALQEERPILREYEAEMKDKKIYYITDLHLMHRIHHAKCVTKDACIYVIQSIIDRFFLQYMYDDNIILLGGDIASDFSIFKLFALLLRKTINERRRNIKVIFTLGNHELWNFQNETIENIVQIYRKLLSDYDMYLLHNEILYTDNNNNNNNISYITSQEINALPKNDIREKLRTARIIPFGGIGFSEYNQKFNANDGVYKVTLSRVREIEETNHFERLYDKVWSCLPERNIIVLTHMPFEDWHFDNKKHDNYVYVSGHNHRNTFYDDGVIRIYSDNQVGYYCENPRLKYFYIDDKYDLFVDYKDGIYQITRDEYIDFYRGKNLQLTYNRKINELYMLKKNEYYCFIHKNASGGLTILNGGSLKSLMSKEIEYYYDNMNAQIAFVKRPLDKFSEIQEKIADSIKHIGGSGYIHGAIIDIDYYNHIYVNPYDLSVTPYFAWDVVQKYFYPSIQALLKEKCPLLYEKYNEYLTTEDNNVLALRENSDKKLLVKPKLYTSTDIYKASRELKKMQKLQTNILSVWYDNVSGIKELKQKDKKVFSKGENVLEE